VFEPIGIIEAEFIRAQEIIDLASSIEFIRQNTAGFSNSIKEEL
tara:strand:- start:890 stop:1021 length:132 start_codon:yes stop_codon:yes gene_type:complete